MKKQPKKTSTQKDSGKKGKNNQLSQSKGDSHQIKKEVPLTNISNPIIRTHSQHPIKSDDIEKLITTQNEERIGLLKMAYEEMFEESNKADLTIKYDGASEIDVDILIKTLQNTSSSLKEISKIESGNEIDINVKSFRKGSFEIPLAINEMVMQGQATLLTQSIPILVETFKNFFELVNLFGGEKITAGKNIGGDKNKTNFEFKNNKGESKVIQVTNTDNSTHTDKSKHKTIDHSKVENHYHGNVYNGTVNIIQRIYVDAAQANSITGLKLLDSNKKVITEVNKNELTSTAREIKIHELLEKKEVKQDAKKTILKSNAILSICRPDLTGKTKWKVAYEGNPIDVKIDDKDFLEDVKNKLYSFYNAAKIKVDLLINQELDEDTGVYLNKDYVATKFHQLLETPGQSNLNLED